MSHINFWRNKAADARGLRAFGAHFCHDAAPSCPRTIPITRCSGGAEQSHKIAQYLLDFRPARSVCGETLTEATMDRATIEPAIRIVLTEIHSKLNEAAADCKSRRGVRACGGCR